MRVSATVCIDSSADRVWALLDDLERIIDWAPGIRSAECPSGLESGAGAERHCRLAGGIELTERFTAWTDGVSFAYEGTGLPGVRVASNTWSVEPVGSAQTILRSEAQVELRGAIRDRLLRGLMRWQSRRAAARSLGAFKHIVETGTLPTRGRRYPAPANC
jgi:carbon monoxide dehydrogenase subunit G